MDTLDIGYVDRDIYEEVVLNLGWTGANVGIKYDSSLINLAVIGTDCFCLQGTSRRWFAISVKLVSTLHTGATGHGRFCSECFTVTQTSPCV